MNKEKDQILQENLSEIDKKQYKLWVLLRQVGHLMTEIRKEDLSPFGMTPAQNATLRSIAHLGEKATPAEIARWLMRKPHTITHLLNRMEKCGQVKKVHDLARKNQVRVILTEKGKQDYNATKKAEYVHPILDFMNDEEREIMETCLNEIRIKLLKERGMASRPPLFEGFQDGSNFENS